MELYSHIQNLQNLDYESGAQHNPRIARILFKSIFFGQDIKKNILADERTRGRTHQFEMKLCM